MCNKGFKGSLIQRRRRIFVWSKFLKRQQSNRPWPIKRGYGCSRSLETKTGKIWGNALGKDRISCQFAWNNLLRRQRRLCEH
jgi:hypothetical protein